MDKKKIIIGGIVAVAVIALIVVCVTVFSGKNESNEKELVATLEKIGKKFYEDYYYPSQEKSQTDVKKFVERFEKNGIKINLTNLSKISIIDKKLIESLINKKTNEKCNYEKTTVTIIPKSPYNKGSYDIKVTLDCGFDKDSKETETKETKETKKTEYKETKKTESKETK